ncbi:MAG: prolyl oligopeptidase family serine peptidase [Candidatus Nanopelagicales bacterium]
MLTPPVAPTHPQVRHLHGHDIADEFAWMADGGQPLMDYLRAEQDHYTAATAPLERLRRRLFTEMVARTPLAEVGPAHACGGAHLRDVVPEGAQLGQLQRRAAAAQQWTTLVDLDAEAAAAGSTYAEYGVREVSPDGRLLAWSIDTTGEELYELRVRDIATGMDRAQRIGRTYYGAAWSADSEHIFYTVVDHVYRPFQVWRHQVGSDPAADVLVLQEDDRRFELSVRSTRCGRWVLIHAGSRDSSETWAIPADDPRAAPASVGGRREGHEYVVESVPGGPELFLAVTNHGRARESTLSWVGIGQTEPAQWLAAVDGPMPGDPEHPGAAGSPLGLTDGSPADRPGPPAMLRRFTGVEAFAGHVVITLREAGRPVLYLAPVRPAGLDWPESRAIRAPRGAAVELASNEEFSAGFVTVVEQSKVEPPSWFDVALAGDGQPALRHRAKAPNHDPSAYVTSSRWVTARDGQRVPVTLVAHRVTALDGTAPCLLFGYGAYEFVYEPTFSRTLTSLLDRGVVYAHAHVRGGGELGRGWWDAGHLATKANSFADLVDVARALGSGPRAQVDGSRIVARGGSAGGLLVAAAMDLDPEAFAAVIAEVPFVDVVNSMLDSELPLTVGEWEEWGNPALAEQFAWMRAYSPYDNVPAAGRRPFVLATGAVHDPRVLVHEPAKWVARLRATDPAHGAVEAVGGRGGVLLRVALGEGSHSGAAGRYAALDEQAQTQAIILAAMGITT